MSTGIRFERDPKFEQQLRSASGSLSGVGLALRKATDRIRDNARELARADASEAEGRKATLATAVKSAPRGSAITLQYRQARAEAWALTKYAELLNGYMTGGRGEEVVGIAIADYAASPAVEYGGPDNGVYVEWKKPPVLEHTPRATMRRALRKAAQ